MKHFSRSSWFASHRRHWFSLKKFIPSNLLSSLVILLLGDILLLIRDDCRCNYRNSCSVDVRSDIFEEDPCPGTGKYIEAQYYCLGWCTHTYLFDRLFNRLLSSTSYTRETGFTIFPSLLNDEDDDDDDTITRKKKINFGESLNYSYYSCRRAPWRKAWTFEWERIGNNLFVEKVSPFAQIILPPPSRASVTTIREKGQDPWFSTLW